MSSHFLMFSFFDCPILCKTLMKLAIASSGFVAITFGSRHCKFLTKILIFLLIRHWLKRKRGSWRNCISRIAELSRSYLIKLKLFSTHIKNSFYCIPHFCSSMTSTSRQLTLKSRIWASINEKPDFSRPGRHPCQIPGLFPVSRTRGNHE